MSRASSVLLLWSVIVLGGVYVFIFEPGRTGFFPPCVFRALTGFTCPSCGATRALHQLLHGHLFDAFALNPLLLIGLPFLLFALVRYSIHVLRGTTPRKNIFPTSFFYALFLIVLSFWIFRNTPIYPFES